MSKGRAKLVRRFKENIFGNPKYDKILERKNYPPGQHGKKSYRAKQSEYGKQLTEKQKIKFTYGLKEKQFRRFYAMAVKEKQATGEVLMQLLERRFDNIVYRAGYGSSRAQARQLVKHSHLRINGKKANIPSMLLKNGDVVEVRPNENSKKLIGKYIEENNWRGISSWIERNEENLNFSFQIPKYEEIPPAGDAQMIVELYSR